MGHPPYHGRCLERRHRIFLSHSGRDKDFVEQLFVDLERVQQSPFFDKSPDSLPKGEQWPRLIFQAARQCMLAVVVLSEDYVCSKWPMLELVTFVDGIKIQGASMKLMPLFYKLSVTDLKDEGKHQEWRNQLKKFADEDPQRFDVDKCLESLKYLSKWNGESFTKPMSEVEYRARIVAGICSLVTPELWDDPDVQGGDRLCKIIANKFQEISLSAPTRRPTLLGMYGMGGIGKTTLSRSLCKYFYEEFSGKVWHVNSPMNPSEPQVVEQLKNVLKHLTEATDGSLVSVTTIEEAGNRLRQRLQSEKAKVFLAVDNIWDNDESKNGAKVVLDCLFPEGSKVLVTARRRDVLMQLLAPHGLDHLMEVPDINQEEAVGILLRHAAKGRKLLDFPDGQKHLIEKIVGSCCFGKGVADSRQYHPFALRTLGGYIIRKQGDDIALWQEILTDVLKYVEGINGDVNKLLQSSFDELPDQLKLVFLDVFRIILELVWDGQLDIDEHIDEGSSTFQRACRWLSIAHDISIKKVEQKLKELRDCGFLDYDEDGGTRTIWTHDLLTNFAEKQASFGSARNSRFFEWKFEDEEPEELVVQGLERIAIQSCGFQTLTKVRFEHCCEVKVLCLSDCSQLRELDLSGMSSLRILDIRSCEALVELKGLHTLRRLVLLRLEYLPRLFLAHEEINHPQRTQYCLDFLSLPFRRRRSIFQAELRLDLQSMVALQYLVIRGTGLKMPPILNRCLDLQILSLYGYLSMSKLPSDLGNLRRLRRLTLKGFSKGRTLPALGFLSSLELLGLVDCESLTHLPRLNMLTALTSLSIRDCHSLSKLPEDVGNFETLRKLKLSFCYSLTKLPDFSRLPLYLESLDLWGSNLEMNIDRAATWESLRSLSLCDCEMLGELFDLSRFPELASAILIGCERLIKVMGSSRRLQKLHLEAMPNLEEIPNLEGLPGLRHLEAYECGELTSTFAQNSGERLARLDELKVEDCDAISVDTLVQWLEEGRNYNSQVTMVCALQELGRRCCKKEPAMPSEVLLRDALATSITFHNIVWWILKQCQFQHQPHEIELLQALGHLFSAMCVGENGQVDIMMAAHIGDWCSIPLLANVCLKVDRNCEVRALFTELLMATTVTARHVEAIKACGFPISLLQSFLQFIPSSYYVYALPFLFNQYCRNNMETSISIPKELKDHEPWMLFMEAMTYHIEKEGIISSIIHSWTPKDLFVGVDRTTFFEIILKELES